MKSIKIAILLGALTVLISAGCDNTKIVDSPTNEYTVPTNYSFSNVAYPGQTVRILLLQDLVSKIAEAETKHVTELELLGIYENTINAYPEIASGKNLSGKVTAGVDSMVRNWFQELDTLSQNTGGFVTPDKRDLKQLIEKYLMGGVFYNQATVVYLNDILSDKNTDPVVGQGTEMEHHWDEAFGYFGASRDYLNMNDETRITPGESDANGDNEIDPQSEKNFYYSVTAAKRDIGAASMAAESQTNFTDVLMGAFLEGRAAISNNDFTTRDNSRSSILFNWEALIAATTVHYALEVKADLKTGGEDIAKHWSELKAYASMLGQNPDGVISNDEYDVLMIRIGNNPSEVTVQNLDQINQQLKSIYQFTDQQVAEW
jgi:hypothetical protein